jgi:UDP-N-acetylglucosamine acyltransferase
MTRIHPTAVIEPGAQVAEGCEIGAYALVGARVRLGPDNVVGPHVVIEGRTEVGPGNRFLQFASIGAGPQADGWAGEAGALVIGGGNVFREQVTVNASLGPEPTRIGDRNLLMAAAHVGHGAVLGSDIRMANAATLGGEVTVQDFAWLGGLSAVHQRARIGAHAFVAGGAMVVQDAPPFCTVQGDRARLAGLNAVGLKRAGYGPGEIAALRRAYRMLFMGAGPMEGRLAAAAALGGEAVLTLVAFMSPSDRGVISTTRRAAA